MRLRSGARQHALAAVEHGHVAFDGGGPEADFRALVEQLDANRVARIGRAREAHEHRTQPVALPRAEALEDRPAGQAHRVEAVGDRPLEAGAPRDRRVGVDRHVVAADQPVQQGGLRRRPVLEGRARHGADIWIPANGYKQSPQQSPRQ